MKVAAPLLAVAVLLVIGAVAIEVLIHQQKQISSQPTVAATPQSRDPCSWTWVLVSKWSLCGSRL